MADKKGTMAKVAAGISTINLGLSIYRDLRTRYEDKFMYTATVDSGHWVFHELMAYVNSQISDARQYKFSYVMGKTRRTYDSDKTQRIFINGHALTFYIFDPGSKASHAGGGFISVTSSKEAVFTARTAEAINALEDLIETLIKEKATANKKVCVYTIDKYNEWSPMELRDRPINSVFLPEGESEALIADIQRFLDSEKRFDSIGMPWHRGYVFSGPPGNGKSSLIKALAHQFARDLYSMQLSAVKNDQALIDAISGIGEGAFLLIEDIDIFSATMKRESNEEGPTLAGLLNALDGVATPHGLITIITTNHVENLDPALIRKGRMDYSIVLEGPNNYQIRSMFRAAYGEELTGELRHFGCMADVADVVKRNLDDPEGARKELTYE